MSFKQLAVGLVGVADRYKNLPTLPYPRQNIMGQRFSHVATRHTDIMVDSKQELKLIAQVENAVSDMESANNLASGGGGAGDQGAETSCSVQCPDYLKIDPSEIKRVRRIGEVGGSAEVFEATWSCCPCAEKKFTYKLAPEAVPVVEKELNLLTTLRHPHVVRLMGFYVDLQQRCCIVMELMSKSLRNLIDSRMRGKKELPGCQCGPFVPSEALDIITKIARGMWFLHSKRIAHRDLKSLNVLLQLDIGGAITEVKIADFGASLNLDLHGTVVGDGTGFWRAPEILKLEPDTKSNLKPVASHSISVGHFLDCCVQRDSSSLKREPNSMATDSKPNLMAADRNPNLMAADVYSFAMTCYEVLTGKKPFEDEAKRCGRENMSASVRDGSNEPLKLPKNVDNNLMELIKNCWAYDPDHRPKFENICKDLQRMRAQRSFEHGKRVSSQWQDQGQGSELDLAPSYDLKNNMEEHHLTIIDHKDLHRTHLIGEPGPYSQVYRATWLGCAFAVKRFHPNVSTDKKEEQQLKLYITLCHPHLVQLIGVSFGPRQELMIVMELMGQSLRQLIDSRAKDSPPFNHCETVLIVRDIAWGMAYLHSKGRLHRNLNSYNVLTLPQEQPGHIRVKIMGFGFEQYLDTSRSRKGTSSIDFWQAPELLLQKELTSEKLLKTADAFSFAMTCYEVFTGKIPFEDERSQGQHNNSKVLEGLRPNLPGDLHPDLKLLIEECWHKEPEKRWEFTKIVDHLQRIEPT